jgi:uncharacterized protein
MLLIANYRFLLVSCHAAQALAQRLDNTIVSSRPTRWLAVLVALFAAALLSAQALAQQAVPPLSGRVVDAAQMLTEADRLRIDAQLAQVEQQRGSQIVALLVASTAPEDIASYANRVANDWKIGRKTIGDGILIIIARDDRKLRIEVAKALEGAIPDLAAKQIIDSALVPALRQGRVADGLEAAIQKLDARIGGENLPAPSAAPGGLGKAESDFQWMDLLIFLFFAVPIGGAVAKSIFGNKLGSLVTGGAVGGIAFYLTASLLVAGVGFVMALIFTLVSSMGRSLAGGRGARQRSRGQDGGFGGWSSGSSSGSWGDGGGFSSGGGGDFGGGGASGDW